MHVPKGKARSAEAAFGSYTALITLLVRAINLRSARHIAAGKPASLRSTDCTIA